MRLDGGELTEGREGRNSRRVSGHEKREETMGSLSGSSIDETVLKIPWAEMIHLSHP